MATDDRTLIFRVLSTNDNRAFAELVNRHQSQLRYSLRQLTGWNETLADDLVQETFILAYKNLNKFRGDAKFYTWLYRIAYRQFASHYRAQKPIEQLPDTEEELSRRLQGEEPLENESESNALHRDMSRALAQLPPDQAMALHLFLHKECTHQEISEIMDSPLGTVKSHIQRGREKLKVLLSEWQQMVKE